MSWVKVYTISATQADNPVAINYTFSSPALIVRAVCPSAQPSWHKAGLLYPTLDIPGIGTTKGVYRKVNLETQMLEIPYLGGLTYAVEFFMYGWLPSIVLTFWQDSSLKDPNKIAEVFESSLARIESKIDAINY